MKKFIIAIAALPLLAGANMAHAGRIIIQIPANICSQLTWDYQGHNIPAQQSPERNWIIRSDPQRNAKSEETSAAPEPTPSASSNSEPPASAKSSVTSATYTCVITHVLQLSAVMLAISNSNVGIPVKNKLTDNVSGVLISGQRGDESGHYNPPRVLADIRDGYDYSQWAEEYWLGGSGGAYAYLHIRFTTVAPPTTDIP